MRLRWRFGVRDLTIEEIEEIAEQYKDDLTREGKRAVRQKKLDEATAAFAAEEYIDGFVRTLKMNAVSGLKEYLARPARARPIRINKHLLSKAK